MGARAIFVSLGLHALVAWLLVRIEPAPAPPPPRLEFIEVMAVSPRPGPPPAPEPTPGPSPASPAVASLSRRRATAAAPARVPEPAPPAATSPMLRMRAVAPAARAPGVTVPPAWRYGRPEGAPPEDELPPGAFLGPVRSPRMARPSTDPTRDQLGPRVEPDGDGGYREDHITFRARVDRDGTVRFKDKGNLASDGVGVDPLRGVLFSGHFDLTDAVMRALGDDPYGYAKLAFLERTRHTRERMAVADRAARLREAQRKLPGYLEKIWAHPRWTAAQKRLLLFALWEEAAEQGSPELERAGAEARSTIEAFVRRRLPQSTSAGYDPAELAELNRHRRCRRRFDPYARGSD